MYALSPPPLPDLHGLLTKVYSSSCACGSSRSDKWVSLSDMMSKYLSHPLFGVSRHTLSLLTVRPLTFWWMIFSHFLDDNCLSSGWLSGVFDVFGLGWTSISLFRRIRNNEREVFVKRRHPRTMWLEIGIGSFLEAADFGSRRLKHWIFAVVNPQEVEDKITARYF